MNLISLISQFIIIIIKLYSKFIINSFDKDNLIIKFIEIKLQGYFSIYNSYNNLNDIYYNVFIL